MLSCNGLFIAKIAARNVGCAGWFCDAGGLSTDAVDNCVGKLVVDGYKADAVGLQLRLMKNQTL